MKDFKTYILDLCNKKEGVEIEFKSAKGGFPGSFWETYSAFANTRGGVIVLGVSEKNGVFTPDGLTEEQVSKYKKAFTDCAHNKGKVSSCLLMERDVIDGDCDGNKVIVFVIPRASYDMRPVYINGNPNNTYRRDHEGDYLCTQAEISRMYADADILAHPEDGKILKNYSLTSDFDETTIRQYRQLFALRHEGHPWNDLDDMEFLKRLEGYKVDRETGEEGFTLAAVLMFGNELAIRDAVPHYFVDYREKLSNDPRIRYTDRVYPDGTWVPNIFQFYYRVYPKLSQALPTPFKLVGDIRQDETLAHEALREAFCNCLIHCQYRMLEGVVIERYQDRLYFSNPGTMLVSPEDFLEGGHSVCRNGILQKMFIAIGRGEHMGSGADTINKGWETNNWPDLEIKEHFGKNNDRVELTLWLQKGSVETEDGRVESRVKSRVETEDGRVETRDRIKKEMKNLPSITLKEIAEKLNLSVKTIEKAVSKMVADGDVVHDGPRKGGTWKVLK